MSEISPIGTALIICGPMSPQVACVVCAPFVDSESNSIFLLGNSSIVLRDEMKCGFPLGEHFVELLFNLSIRLNAFNLRNSEKALFSALVLISPGRLYIVHSHTHTVQCTHTHIQTF